MLQSPPITLLFVVRHGRTILNAENCFRGNKDVPLDPTGIRDAYNVRKLFEDEPLSFIVSSDRVRATKTADIIHEERSFPKQTTETLRALNVGDFSGKPRTKENEDLLQHYLDQPNLDIPGGESLNQFKSRIRPALWEAIEIADDSGLPGMLVAHSSVIHEVGAWLYDSHKSVLVEPGGVIAIFIQDGKLGASAIHKPITNPLSQAKTVS